MRHCVAMGKRIPLEKKNLSVKKRGFYGRLNFLLWYKSKSLKHYDYFPLILLYPKLNTFADYGSMQYFVE